VALRACELIPLRNKLNSHMQNFLGLHLNHFSFSANSGISVPHRIVDTISGIKHRTTSSFVTEMQLLDTTLIQLTVIYNRREDLGIQSLYQTKAKSKIVSSINYALGTPKLMSPGC